MYNSQKCSVADSDTMSRSPAEFDIIGRYTDTVVLQRNPIRILAIFLFGKCEHQKLSQIQIRVDNIEIKKDTFKCESYNFETFVLNYAHISAF